MIVDAMVIQDLKKRKMNLTPKVGLRKKSN